MTLALRLHSHSCTSLGLKMVRFCCCAFVCPHFVTHGGPGFLFCTSLFQALLTWSVSDMVCELTWSVINQYYITLICTSFLADGSVKDITAKYAPRWLSHTRKQRVESVWWRESLQPYASTNEELDNRENESIKGVHVF